MRRPAPKPHLEPQNVFQVVFVAYGGRDGFRNLHLKEVFKVAFLSDLCMHCLLNRKENPQSVQKHRQCTFRQCHCDVLVESLHI